MAALQAHAFEKTLLLKMGVNPVAGILPADVTYRYRKQGQTAFQTKTLTADDWVVLGDGYYVIKFAPADMDTMGNFYFSVDGGAFDLQEHEFSIEPLPAGIAEIPASVCVVQGTVLDAGGNPLKNILVTAKGLSWPYQSNQNVLGDSYVDTRTDYLGRFELVLIRGAKVLVEIEKTGIRAQVTVPNVATVLLNDLITFPANS